MCDAFLKVKWYDEENSVGYSEYEFYNQGKKVNRVAHAMIYLDDDRPEFMIDLEQFRKDLEREHKKGDLKTIFEMIEEGKFNRQGQGNELTLVIDKGNGKLFINEFSSFLSDWNMPLMTLADHKMNVCIPYPDNQRMYFAEQKRVNDIHEIDRKRAELKKWIANLSFWDYYIPIDLNFDGKEDYLTGTSVICSHDGNYFEMKINAPELNSDSPNSKLISPINGKQCEFLDLFADYVTTDGKNYFINNQCNLTELTK